MVRAALHQDISRFEVNFRIIEEHVNLAGQNDGIVDRPGAVHSGIAGLFAGRSFGDEAEALDNLQPGFVIGRNFLLGGEFDDSKDSAAWRRRDSDFSSRGVLIA